jgi:phenylacetate-CoA ligase
MSPWSWVLLPEDLWAALVTPSIRRRSVQDFQSRRLRRLVRHSYQNVPFYRRLYDAHGVRPESIRGIEDLSRLPIIEKADLLNVPVSERISEGSAHANLIPYRTSGSTGEPMTFNRTWLETRVLELVRIRMNYESGITPRSKRFRLADRPPTADDQSLVNRVRKLGWFRIDWHDPLDDPHRIVAAMLQSKPDVVMGMTSLLDRLVTAVGADAFRQLRPCLVAVGGDDLTPSVRERLAQAFGAQVINTYGSFEFNLIAHPCPQAGRFHTCDNSVIVEVLRGGEAATVGQRGEVVVTGLHSWAMPLIRYRQSDLAVRGPESCQCGRPFGSIERLEGRMVDTIQLPDGHRMHAFELVTPWWDHHRWVGRYQLVQETLTEIRLLIQPSRPPTADEIDDVRWSSQRVLGEGVELKLELTDRIHPPATGKFRLVMSKVGRPTNDGAHDSSRCER